MPGTTVPSSGPSRGGGAPSTGVVKTLTPTVATVSVSPPRPFSGPDRPGTIHGGVGRCRSTSHSLAGQWVLSEPRGLVRQWYCPRMAFWTPPAVSVGGVDPLLLTLAFSGRTLSSRRTRTSSGVGPGVTSTGSWCSEGEPDVRGWTGGNPGMTGGDRDPRGRDCCLETCLFRSRPVSADRADVQSYIVPASREGPVVWAGWTSHRPRVRTQTLSHTWLVSGPVPRSPRQVYFPPPSRQSVADPRVVTLDLSRTFKRPRLTSEVGRWEDRVRRSLGFRLR